MNLPHIAVNLLHLEGGPGLMPYYSPGMGCGAYAPLLIQEKI